VKIASPARKYILASVSSKGFSGPDNTIRVFRHFRVALKCALGEQLTVQAFPFCKPATSVVFAPISETANCIVGDYLDLITNSGINFDRIPLWRDMIIPIYSCHHVFEFRVIAAAPNSAVVVHDLSVLQCQSSPVPREKTPDYDTISYDDIGGIDLQLLKIRKYLENPRSVGFLITAPSGCGKTFLSQAIRNEVNYFFEYISILDLVSYTFERATTLLGRLFEAAAQKPPGVLYFDDLDAIAEGRLFHDGQPDPRLRNLLAGFIDRARRIPNLVLIATAKSANRLPLDFKPPSRFSEEIHIDIPSKDERREILEVISRKMPKAGENALIDIAIMTDGQTPSDLFNVCQKSLMNQLVELVAGLDVADTHVSFANLRELSIGAAQFAKRKVKKKKNVEQAAAPKKYSTMDPFGDILGGDLDDEVDDQQFGAAEDCASDGDMDIFGGLEQSGRRRRRHKKPPPPAEEPSPADGQSAHKKKRRKPTSGESGDPFGFGADIFTSAPANPDTFAVDPFGADLFVDAPLKKLDADPFAAAQPKKAPADPLAAAAPPKKADPFAAAQPKKPEVDLFATVQPKRTGADPFASPPKRPAADPFGAAPPKKPEPAADPFAAVQPKKTVADPFGPAPKRPEPAADPFATAAPKKPSADPFGAAPTKGEPAADPFAAAPSKRPAAADPFVAATKKPETAADPFAPAPPKKHVADPFAAAPKKGEPFAAAPAKKTGTVVDLFATAPPKGPSVDPFAAAPNKGEPAADPFGAAPGKKTEPAADLFAAAPAKKAGTVVDPFSTTPPKKPGADPFGGSAKKAEPAADPFAAVPPEQPAMDPFGTSADEPGADPFATAPPKKSAADPFAAGPAKKTEPAGDPFAADPFAAAPPKKTEPAADPFAAAPKNPDADPFATAPPKKPAADPFAAGPAKKTEPAGDPFAADPFAAAPPKKTEPAADPFAAAPQNPDADPFATAPPKKPAADPFAAAPAKKLAADPFGGADPVSSSVDAQAEPQADPFGTAGQDQPEGPDSKKKHHKKRKLKLDGDAPDAGEPPGPAAEPGGDPFAAATQPSRRRHGKGGKPADQ
jgi:AAA+ superfamily predicted ATPase